jgi:DNA-directed RNA polymerase specialized sigma24 family protein
MTPTNIDDVKAWLRAAFNDVPARMADGDGQLTERFLQMLNHLCAASAPFVSWRQATILSLYFGPARLSQERIAEVLGVSDRTVRRDYNDALENIAERVSL